MRTTSLTVYHDTDRATDRPANEDPSPDRSSPSAATLHVLPHTEARPPDPPEASSGVDADEAQEFLQLFFHENPTAGSYQRRWTLVRHQIAATGTYRHTNQELTFGAKVAWRNSARCIGRLYWRSLHVRDARAATTAQQVNEELLTHLRHATNGGRIRPTLTVFAPPSPQHAGVRIWNEQLIRYAGWRQPDGSVIGDPRNAGFTELCQALGWSGGSGGRFDVLPWVIQVDGGHPHVFELPAEAVLEVPLSHPHYPWLAELDLRWHAVPAISNMRLQIGGIGYRAAPFNGWYMGTEIGARNLADTDRYNLIPEVATRLGLDTSRPTTLWRDRALVELNIAVLHSFAAAGVTIADHHTESDRFLTHVAKEHRAGRITPADWSWIVPPMSGALTSVFHRYYDQAQLSPNFHLDPATAALAAGRAPANPNGHSSPAQCPFAHQQAS